MEDNHSLEVLRDLPVADQGRGRTVDCPLANRTFLSPTPEARSFAVDLQLVPCLELANKGQKVAPGSEVAVCVALQGEP